MVLGIRTRREGVRKVSGEGVEFGAVMGGRMLQIVVELK